MKTFVHLDPSGVIQSLVTVDAPDGVTAMLQPDAGVLIAEVDAPEFRQQAEPDVERLRQVLASYRVSAPSFARGTLKKGGEGSREK